MYTNVSLKRRILIFAVVVCFVATLLVGRLYYVQIYSSKDLKTKALDQWLRDIPVSAKRGSIKDRNGVDIVTSVTAFDIYVRQALVENAEKEARIYADTLNLSYDEVYNKVTDYKISENLLIKNASKDQIDELLEKGVNSFVASESFVRNYDYDSLLSQIIGITSTDGEGLSGLEYYYNQYLSGVKGLSMVDSDARGKELENANSYYVPSIDGMNITTTIDIKIQAEVEKIMANAKSSTGAKSVSSLVMNPKSGEILSICSLPSFNLNEIPRDDLETLNKLNRSFLINDTYEPGSTFKTIVAAIALDIGVATINTPYYCPGYRIVDGVRTNCHKKTGHGPQTLTTGFVNSCNCVFMQVVSDIGVERFYEYVKKFHFDELLGVDYTGEATAIIIDKNLAKTNDFLRMGFGQSIAISGLQLASAISAICTNGYIVKPHFVKNIMDNDGNIVYENKPTKLNRVVKESIIKDMQYMMAQVVLKGGGKASSVEGHTVGGKTGTAQKYENGKISTGNYIGSYICASPIEDPEYIVLVVIDEPRSSIYGNIVATPVAGEILRAIYGITDKSTANIEDMIEVPNLIGRTLTEAGSMLASLGLYYVTEGDGKVVSYQSIKDGTKVEKGSSIMIRFE